MAKVINKTPDFINNLTDFRPKTCIFRTIAYICIG